MNKIRQKILIASSLFFFGTVFAAPDTDNLPTYQHPPDFHVSGYVDASYNYLSQSNKFVSGIFNRDNDIAENGFSLQQAALTLAKEPHYGFGGVISFILGRDAYDIAPQGYNPDLFGNPAVGFVIPEAYLRYKTGNTILKLGEMRSLAGIEQYNYTNDTNFSRSILDSYAEPGIHTGLRGIHKINEELSLIAGLMNGWNTIHNAATPKAVELAVSYMAKPWLTYMINTFTGKQYLTDETTSGPTYWRNLIDIYGTLGITKQLSLAGNYDYGFQTRAELQDGTLTRASWQGVTGYINYLLNERWFTSLRAEVFNDVDGYRTGVKQSWYEATLSLAYFPIKNLQLRVETRRDFSSTNAFLAKNGVNTSINQQSFAFDVLYQFT